MNEWSFIEHITSSLNGKRYGDPKQPTLWPSEASAVIDVNGREKVVGHCRRSTFFRYLLDNYKFYDKYKMWKPLVEEVSTNSLAVDKYLLWIWRQGELYEEFLIEQSKISGIFIAGQVPVFIPEINLSGKVDILCINPYTHKHSQVEAKSVYGFGANTVLGTPGARRKGGAGTPRDSNLMQIALYHWWSASEDDSYEESRLVYGSRDTGRYGEYLVKTELEEDRVKILYKAHHPNVSDWIESPITINSIVREYKNQQLWLDGGIVPKRDFDLLYSEEQLAELFTNDELTKAEKEQYEKVILRREENAALELLGKKPKKELKQIEKGNWNCSLCSFRTVCYDKNNQPRDL